MSGGSKSKTSSNTSQQTSSSTTNFSDIDGFVNAGGGDLNYSTTEVDYDYEYDLDQDIDNSTRIDQDIDNSTRVDQDIDNSVRNETRTDIDNDYDYSQDNDTEYNYDYDYDLTNDYQYDYSQQTDIDNDYDYSTDTDIRNDGDFSGITGNVTYTEIDGGAFDFAEYLVGETGETNRAIIEGFADATSFQVDRFIDFNENALDNNNELARQITEGSYTLAGSLAGESFGASVDLAEGAYDLSRNTTSSVTQFLGDAAEYVFEGINEITNSFSDDYTRLGSQTYGAVAELAKTQSTGLDPQVVKYLAMGGAALAVAVIVLR